MVLFGEAKPLLDVGLLGVERSLRILSVGKLDQTTRKQIDDDCNISDQYVQMARQVIVGRNQEERPVDHLGSHRSSIT